jgi:hypothetical protein
MLRITYLSTTYLGDNCIVFENFMLNKLYDIAWFGSDQTSVYTLGEILKNRNNSTVFEELEVSIVDLNIWVSHIVYKQVHSA